MFCNMQANWTLTFGVWQFSQKLMRKSPVLLTNYNYKESLRTNQRQSKAIMKQHNKPENVDIRLPKCEQSIWNEIPGKACVTDVKFQTIQTVLLGAINCQREVANVLLAQKSSKDILTTCLDSITLAMTANYDSNLQRREAMRPEFAKGLCSSASPADKFLFGGDTAKRVKEINELTKLNMCRSFPTHRGPSQRYHPYLPRGSRSNFLFCGRRSRGRGFTYTPSSQCQNFQSLLQPEKNPTRSLQPTGMLN